MKLCTLYFFVHSEPYRAHAGWHSTRGWSSSFRRQFHHWIYNSGRKTFTSVVENNINLFLLLKHLLGLASYSCKSSNVISLTLLNSLDFYNTDQNFFCSIQRKVEEANQQKKLNLDISYILVWICQFSRKHSPWFLASPTNFSLQFMNLPYS